MILVAFAIAAIAIGLIGTAMTVALSMKRNFLADPVLLAFIGLTGAGLSGLEYLLT